MCVFRQAHKDNQACAKDYWLFKEEGALYYGDYNLCKIKMCNKRNIKQAGCG